MRMNESLSTTIEPTGDESGVSELPRNELVQTELAEKESVGEKGEEPPFRAVASTYEEAKEIIRDYEIEHTVHFSCFTGATRFNAGIERWMHADGRSNSPRLMWGSQYVPHTGRPYIKVGNKHMACQYSGKQRVKPDKVNNPLFTMKIGCPCHVHIAEVERLMYPTIKHVDGYSTRNQRTVFAGLFRANVRKYLSGLPHELVFKREFHVTISPLSAHNHAIGEAAGPHEKVDPILRSRIQEIAASGVVATDLIRDDLERFVENLFVGKQLPLKTNRRFYPTVKDIRNHVEKAKMLQNFNRSLPSQESFTEDAVASSHIEGVTYHDNGETVEIGRYESVELIEQQDYHDVEQYFADYSPTSGDKYADVSSFSTVTTTKKAARNSKSHSKTPETTTKLQKGRTRSPKEKSLSLVKKLYKIVNAIDSGSNDDMSKLMSALIDAMMVAKPLVPQDKVRVIFEDEPRPLLGPRRVRPKKRRPPVPLKQKHPEINPNALSWSDIKAKQDAERKRKREVAAAMEAARRAQRKARSHAAMAKRNKGLSASSFQVVPATPFHSTSVTPVTISHEAHVEMSPVSAGPSPAEHERMAVVTTHDETQHHKPDDKNTSVPRVVVLRTQDVGDKIHLSKFFVTETVVESNTSVSSDNQISAISPSGLFKFVTTNSQTLTNILPKTESKSTPSHISSSAVLVTPLSKRDCETSHQASDAVASTKFCSPPVVFSSANSSISMASKQIAQVSGQQTVSRSGRIIKRKIVESL